MNDDRTQLIIQLCTQAGMILEDSVGPALTIRRIDVAHISERIAEIGRAADRISALVRAAQVLADVQS